MGPLQLHRRVGRGGVGEVWSGQHGAATGQRTQVAVKFLSAGPARSATFRQAFQREIRAIAALDHPNIVRVYDAGQTDEELERTSGGRFRAGTPYLVMELVSGGTLARHQGEIGWDELRVRLLELLDALAHAHARGLIHRDIKPGNLMRDGRTGAVRLADFGLAEALDRRGEGSVDAQISGTPNYMAPEQIEGRWRDVGPWTDLYSVGCVAWSLVTGDAPFAGREGPAETMYAHLELPLPPLEPAVPLPGGLESWLRRLLDKEPHRRFTRAADAAGALVALDGRPRRPRPPPARTSPHLDGAGLALYGARSIPLVGRREELDRCGQALDRVRRTGRPGLLLLRGPAGCGKSRLAAGFCERAHEVGDASVLRASHGPVPGPIDGLGPMVARRLRLLGLTADEATGRLQAFLERAGGSSYPDEAQALCELCLPAGDPAARTVRFASPRERHVLLERLLARLARERPVVLVLEDVQWGIDALGFAGHLLASRSPAPVLVVLTARDEALAERPVEEELLSELLAADGSDVVAVGPLEGPDRRALVRALLGLGGPLAAQVESRTAGNPLFAVQLVGDWVQRGLLIPGVGGFRLRDGVRPELPDDLHAWWDARIERLLVTRSEADALALEVAAALGQDVEVAEWARAAPHTDGALVDDLEAQRLVSWGADQASWSFSNGMLRESLERRARDHGRWARHNLACVRMLRDSAGPRRAERLGRHLLAAGQPEQALGPLLEAAWERSHAGDFRESLVLLSEHERALTGAGAPPSDLRWGELLLQGRDLANRAGDLAAAEAFLRRYDEGEARHGWVPLHSRALLARAARAHNQGALEEALALLDRAEPELRADREHLQQCRRYKGRLLTMLGRLDAAREVVAELAGEVRAAGNRRREMRCQQLLGRIELHAGRLDEAGACFQRGLRMCEESGYRQDRAHFLNLLGEVARYSGDLAGAERRYAGALEGFEAIGSGDAAIAEANLAVVVLEQGRYDRARQLLDRSLVRFEQEGLKHFMGLLHALLLPCCAAAGSWGSWQHHFDEAVGLLEETGYVEPDGARAARLAAAIAAEAGQPERARDALGFAASQLRLLGREDELSEVEAQLEDR